MTLTVQFAKRLALDAGYAGRISKATRRGENTGLEWLTFSVGLFWENDPLRRVLG